MPPTYVLSFVVYAIIISPKLLQLLILSALLLLLLPHIPPVLLLLLYMVPEFEQIEILPRLFPQIPQHSTSFFEGLT
ncbi:MAG: hypothetical protein MJ211_15180 [Bacteroidales bacterium]|nr:hypothetical protein [Bacteroidales bacterium]